MIDTDEDAALSSALALKAVVERYAAGDSAVMIAMDLGRSVQYVHGMIKRAAEEVRATNQDRVNAAFLQQDVGLQHLIRACMTRLTFEGKPYFDSDAVRCLIMVYDRQAKLHGLDRAKVNAAGGTYSWLETASPQVLLETAAKMGIRVPKPFTGADS